jgi:S1-C subfamily serine protease
MVSALALALLLSGCGVVSTVAPNSAPAAATPATPATATAAPTATEAPQQQSTLTPINELAAARALEDRLIAVYETASPAVVNITSRFYVYAWRMQAIPQEGTGSGFVYDRKGRIVTNYHVIENAEELLVTLADGEVYEAEVVGTDPNSDLAVIQIDAGASLPEPLSLGDSDALRVGQFVLAVGNPFGLEQTLTTGVISALGRVIESPEESGFIGEAIQTDAAINPGNSGGPLLDLDGNVIGINSQIISTSGSSAGIGFAVSANTMRRVLPELVSRGYYPHPWLGVQTTSLNGSLANVLRQAGASVPVEAGVLVLETVAGGPADEAGIRGGDRIVRISRYSVAIGGDIITAINGQPITDSETLTVYLEAETSVGDSVQVTILRGDEERVVPLTLAERPQQ